MKIRWKTIRWFILAALIPATYYKVRVAFTSGYTDYMHLVSEILFSLIVSIIFTTSIAYLIHLEVEWLERKLPWKKHQVKRIFAEFFLTNFTVSILMSGVSFIMFIIHSSTVFNKDIIFKEYLMEYIALGIVLNLLLVSLGEGAFFFKQWKNNILLSERLEREKILSQLEALKNQVNPHFLFNSLNVLSSLVHADANKAEEFIDEFASVYRYILSIQDKTIVSLREELHFLDSYIFLQKIRFQDGLKMHLHIEAEQLDKCLPPLSLQMLVENAIKHNVVGKEKPLNIRIYTEKNSLFIVNELQVRPDKPSGTGIGLKNMRERYFRLAGIQPKFEIQGNEYIAQIPLFDNDPQITFPTIDTDRFKCPSFNMGIFNSSISELGMTGKDIVKGQETGGQDTTQN